MKPPGTRHRPTLDGTQANILTHGKLGQIVRQTGRFTAQLHGMTEQLDTAIGRMYLPGCPWRLGDSRCQVDLGPFTRTGTVTAVPDGDAALYLQRYGTGGGAQAILLRA